MLKGFMYSRECEPPTTENKMNIEEQAEIIALVAERHGSRPIREFLKIGPCFVVHFEVGTDGDGVLPPNAVVEGREGSRTLMDLADHEDDEQFERARLELNLRRLGYRS